MIYPVDSVIRPLNNWGQAFGSNVYMATKMRNDTWKEDEELNQDLEEYARQELKWDEILDFVSKKCPSYNVQL